MTTTQTTLSVTTIHKEDMKLCKHVKNLLCYSFNSNTTQTQTLSKSIESALYKQYVITPLRHDVQPSKHVRDGILKKYRNAARRIICTLKTKLGFRKDVLSGDLKVAALVMMSSEDLNPSASIWKERRQRLQNLTEVKQKEEEDEARKNSIMEKEAGSWNERCPKCRGTNFTYYQLQTRSADEPMSVFYHCKPPCNAKWKR